MVSTYGSEMFRHDVSILYMSCFFLIKHNREGKDVDNEIFNNTPHFIKTRIRVNFIQDGFAVYNDTLLIFQPEFIPLIHGYMIPVDFRQKINLLQIFLLTT